MSEETYSRPRITELEFVKLAMGGLIVSGPFRRVLSLEDGPFEVMPEKDDLPSVETLRELDHIIENLPVPEQITPIKPDNSNPVVQANPVINVKPPDVHVHVEPTPVNVTIPEREEIVDVIRNPRTGFIKRLRRVWRNVVPGEEVDAGSAPASC